MATVAQLRGVQFAFASNGDARWINDGQMLGQVTIDVARAFGFSSWSQYLTALTDKEKKLKVIVLKRLEKKGI